MKKIFLILNLTICYLASFSQQLGTFTDTRDGKIYKTVKIKNQIWMAENLAFKPDNGNYWAPVDNKNNVAKYGYLYDLQTANKVCPIGWHLPSKEEIDTLLQNVGGKGSNASNALIPTGNSGFSALFAGFRNFNGTSASFSSIGSGAFFWSSSAYFFYVWEKDAGVILSYTDVSKCGYSVRCIKD